VYEIWLVMNILWEIALEVWPVVAGIAVLWVIAMARAWGRSATGWRRAVPAALGAGAVAAIIAFLVVPGLTKSSLSELAYWVDWANLLAIAIGAGALVALFAWPLLAARGRSGAH
jgi:hypothetical protein